MNKSKADKKPKDENLPFNFLKNGPDDEHIEAHWQKIKDKITKTRSKAPTSRKKN